MTTLVEAQAKHDQLFADFRATDRAQAELARSGVLLSPDGGGQPQRLDPVEAAIAAAELAERKRELAPKLRQAIELLRAARVAHANDRLRVMAAAHAETVAAVDAARARVEEAWLSLAVAGIELGEAVARERKCAQGCVREAQAATTNDDVRDEILEGARDGGVVPVLLDPAGRPSEVQARPETGLFKHGGLTWEPLQERCYEELAAVIAAGRERIGRCASERVAALLHKKLNNN